MKARCQLESCYLETTGRGTDGAGALKLSRCLPAWVDYIRPAVSTADGRTATRAQYQALIDINRQRLEVMPGNGPRDACIQWMGGMHGDRILISVNRVAGACCCSACC